MKKLLLPAVTFLFLFFVFPANANAGCSDYQSQSSCTGKCGGVKSDGKSYTCKWLTADQKCSESANICGNTQTAPAKCDENTQGVDASIGVCCVPGGGTSYDDDPNSPTYGKPFVGTHWTTCVPGYTCNQGYGCFKDGNPQPSATPPPPLCEVSDCRSQQACLSVKGKMGDECGVSGGGALKYECTYFTNDQSLCIPTPTPAISAQCVRTRIYSPNWTAITQREFQSLLPKSKVYFCVAGSTTAGSFDFGRFRINGVLRDRTDLKHPTRAEFCDLYTIPENTYSFKVQGLIHHKTLGWL